MNIEEVKKAQYEANDRELLERFPHFSLRSGKGGQKKVILSSGQELDLGQVHPAALEYLMSTIKFMNRLSEDPLMISYDRLKAEYGE